MIIRELSPKQGEIFKFAFQPQYDTLVSDGAVRSGKTLAMSHAFFTWGMENFNGQNFILAGKTVQSTERNVLRPLQRVEGLPYDIDYKVSKKYATVRCGKKENYFYVFGGKDESSADLVQGITAAGAMLDEVALQPQSFFEQVQARTLSFSNAKMWLNCNPESPNHWFYREWMLERKDSAKYLHFTMRDNPIMGEEQIARAESMFSGVFFERFVRGRWVVAEGAIYRLFIDNKPEFMCSREDVPGLREVLVGVDFGGNTSQHAFCATGFDTQFNPWVLRSESIPAKDMDIDTLTKHFVRFCEGIERDYGRVDGCYCDSAEQAIINQFRNRTKYRIYNSDKGQIIDRIRCASMMMGRRGIKFVDGQNDNLVRALEEAVWDSRQLDDVRLDDGSYNMDVIDAWEYSWSYHIARIAR